MGQCPANMVGEASFPIQTPPAFLMPSSLRVVESCLDGKPFFLKPRMVLWSSSAVLSSSSCWFIPETWQQRRSHIHSLSVVREQPVTQFADFSDDTQVVERPNPNFSGSSCTVTMGFSTRFCRTFSSTSTDLRGRGSSYAVVSISEFLEPPLTLGYASIFLF